MSGRALKHTASNDYSDRGYLPVISNMLEMAAGAVGQCRSYERPQIAVADRRDCTRPPRGPCAVRDCFLSFLRGRKRK